MLVNSTVSGNSNTNGSASGIAVEAGSGDIRFSTITANSGTSSTAQLSRSGTATLTMSGSIVANPTSGINCAGLAPGTSTGNNLDSSNTCGFATVGDLINSNPQLAALASNGGPTLTHALQAGSAAINAGPTTGTLPATDQRGAGFARVLNGQADIGAFESAFVTAPTLPVVSLGNASISEGHIGTKVLNFPVTLSSAAPAGGVTLTYSTANGSATAGSDYVAAVGGTLLIASGESTGNLPLTVNSDTTIEPDETFTVTITGALNATLGAATATGTILNDDVVVAMPVTPVPVNSAWMLLASMLGVLAFAARGLHGTASLRTALTRLWTQQ